MTASDSSVQVIRRLDDAVVNKIAAGEVIQRPSSALKELLENSLDAGATQISIVVKEGGNKLLQITDNGHGIRKEDLPILCHRHTTSKLKSFEDLDTIHTLGFRGEALCSISFVSNMTVTTMTRDAVHGYRVSFKDSEMDAAGPKPVAAVQGTTIAVEDLFYNVPTRRKALKSAAEEYARILDVVSRYAVFKAGCGFNCKRHGEARADVNTLASGTRLDNIRAVYGAAVAKELLPLSLKVGKAVADDIPVEDEVSFTLEAFVSSANYAAKRSTCILFVNDRCVESGALRRAVEATYAAVLPKASRPFLFFDLHMPPRHVDVNMHPTKREVGLLNQEEVVERIRAAVEAKLVGSNTTRTFTQVALPFAPQPLSLPEPLRERVNRTDAADSSQAAQPSYYRPDKLVRVDARTQSLDLFLQPGSATQGPSAKAAALAGSVARKRSAPGADPPRGALGALGGEGEEDGEEVGPAGDDARGVALQGPVVASIPKAGAKLALASELSSIAELAEAWEKGAHEGLGEMLRMHTLVGMADDTLALVQHQTKLYLANVTNLSHDLFYQLVLQRFEGVGRQPLSPPIPLADLMAMALELEAARGAWQPEHGSKEEICALSVELLLAKAPMLAEYVGMDVDDEGRLSSLPVLLEGYAPDLGRLPGLVLALARDVDWEEEVGCFRGLAEALADCYALRAPLVPGTSPDVMAATHHQEEEAAAAAALIRPGGVAGASGQDEVMAGDEGAGAEEQGRGQGGDMEVEARGGQAGTGSRAGGEEAGLRGTEQGGLGQAGGGARSILPTEAELKTRDWVIRHVLFPALRSLRAPRRRAQDGTFVQVASLEKLYRIFERC